MTKKNGAKKTEEEVEETDTEEEEETDTDSADEESAEEESEDEEESDDDESEDDEAESDDDESEDEDDSDGSSTDDDDDIDDEIEKERKAGEPDPVIAKNAFKDRKNKRGAADTESDDDKPLTRGEARKLEDRIRKETLEREAHALAKELSDGSAKQAQLILLKWKNRTFPASLTLREQLTEAFVLANSKKLIGERNEALRALKGKRGVKDTAAGTHRDAPRGPGEPKLPPSEAATLRQSGFSWNVRTKRYEKKLPNGILIRDNQTKQVKFERRR